MVPNSRNLKRVPTDEGPGATRRSIPSFGELLEDGVFMRV